MFAYPSKLEKMNTPRKFFGFTCIFIFLASVTLFFSSDLNLYNKIGTENMDSTKVGMTLLKKLLESGVDSKNVFFEESGNLEIGSEKLLLERIKILLDDLPECEAKIAARWIRKESICDAWNNRYVVVVDSMDGDHAMYWLRSFGEDGMDNSGGGDDITIFPSLEINNLVQVKRNRAQE